MLAFLIADSRCRPKSQVSTQEYHSCRGLVTVLLQAVNSTMERKLQLVAATLSLYTGPMQELRPVFVGSVDKGDFGQV